MPGLFDMTLIMIYLLPVLGLILGMLPTLMVWHFCLLKRSRAKRKVDAKQVNNRFTLSL